MDLKANDLNVCGLVTSAAAVAKKKVYPSAGERAAALRANYVLSPWAVFYDELLAQSVSTFDRRGTGK